MARKRSLVYGVGINDANYQVCKTARSDRYDCPYYDRWRKMLARCYSVKWQKKYPTYIGCSVCAEWLVFSAFKAWMEKQDWSGKHLDKDLLNAGNKIYSPETCVFIPQNINKFLNSKEKNRGEYMIGVSLHKGSGMLQSQCNDGNGNQVHLGYYNNEIDAHNAWRNYKRYLALKLADGQNDQRVKDALAAMYLD